MLKQWTRDNPYVLLLAKGVLRIYGKGAWKNKEE